MFTLVPSQFFAPEDCRSILSEVGAPAVGEEVCYAEIPQYGAVLIYTVSGGDGSLPEIFSILDALPDCPEYNRILCSWKDSIIYIAIAQGKTLLLANSFRAPVFSTAEYYIFLAMKSLQLNPEVSVITFMERTFGPDEEMSLYRYFKAVHYLKSA